MRKTNKNRRNKHGASSVFLAVILSALILIECTFAAFVWNLDYALSVNTALKTQIDTIMADYDRQLFDVYGVYAFTLDEIDDECFRKALEINGLSSASVLYINGTTEFTADDLKKAINSFYFYRGTGIAMKSIVDGYKEMILELDDRGIFSRIGEFMQSPAAGYVSEMIKGSESAEEWIGKAGDMLNIGELIGEAADMDSLSSDYKDAIADFELDIDVDVAEWDSILTTVSRLEDIMDAVSDNPDFLMTHMNTAHYCAYNFDCWFPPAGDCSITGTEFKSIHGSKKADSEYIITGLDTFPACLKIEYLMVQVLIVSNMLKDFADETFRNTMEVLGEIISVIILAVSEGTVDIDPKLIAVGLTYYCAIVQSMKDFLLVVNGQRAVIFEYDDVEFVTFSYRDFLYLFSFLTPEDELLERSHEVLIRDYGTLYKGIALGAEFRGEEYTVEKSYQLYE